MKNKKTRNIIIASLIFIIAFLGIKFITKPKVHDGQKKVQITIVDDSKQIYYDKQFQTDKELLGDLLDELQEIKELDITFDGSKDSEFGRYITAIDHLNQNDPEYHGCFWIYESDTNESCQSMCPGIDKNALTDADTFVFKFTNEFN